MFVTLILLLPLYTRVCEYYAGFPGSSVPVDGDIRFRIRSVQEYFIKKDNP